MVSKVNLDEIRAVVRDAGLRATPSRLAVLQVLRAAEQPMSHGEVAERLANLASDPATVYRNLIDFVEVGLARRTDMGDHTWRFEAVGSKHQAVAHPHFVCTSCGVVECLPEMDFVVPRAKTPRAIKQRKIEVHVRGLCDGCA